MNLLFVNIPFVGHINPTLALAEELVKRGHTVTYILTEEWRDKINAFGGNFIAYQNFEDIHTLDDINQKCYSAAYYTGLAEGNGYDLLIYEAWFFLGETLGEKLKIPTIRLFTTFALNKSVTDELLRESNNLRVFLNDDIGKWHTEHLIGEIAIREHDFLKEMIYNIPKLNIIFTSKWFQVDAQKFDQRYEFVGTSISMSNADSGVDFGKNHEKPIIYISLGTVYNKNLNFYKNCINEFANKEYTVFISVGEQGAMQCFKKLPENIHVYTYISQKELLKKSALFITHGGMNSINEALYYGVPMIIIPQDADQPFNAHRVKELNLGTLVKMDEVNNKLYMTAKYIIEDKKMKKKIQYAQKQLKISGGVIKAADLVEGYEKYYHD